MPVHADRERVFGVIGLLDDRAGQQDPVPHDVVLAGGPGFRVVLFQRQHADGERVVPEAALGGTYPDDRDRVAPGPRRCPGCRRGPASVMVRVPPCARACPESSSRCRSARAARVRPNRSSPVSVTVACPAATSRSRTAGSLISSAAAGDTGPGRRPGAGRAAPAPRRVSAEPDLPGVPVDRPVVRDVGVVAGVQVRAQVIDQPGVLAGGQLGVQQGQSPCPAGQAVPAVPPARPARPAGRTARRTRR